jgi:glucosylceramidase
MTRPFARRLVTVSAVLGLMLAVLSTAGSSAAAKAKPKAKVTLGPAVGVTLTTKSLSRALSSRPDIYFSTQRVRVRTLGVNDRIRYQHVQGFGGAMTDSSAWLLHDKLPVALRNAAMTALFSRTQGIGLNLVRVPMGASDFTVHGVPYSYDDLAAGQTDPGLQHFSIAHDRAYILPSLRQMLRINRQVQVLSTEWSPPGWMKANDSMDNIGGKGVLLPQFYGTLANYFVKFIQAYRAAGVPITAITPQNEPLNQTIYPGLALTATDEGDFIYNHLHPALKQAHLATKLYGADDGNQLFYGQDLMGSPAARDLNGMAWHCYGGPDVMTHFHDLYPKVREIMSECSTGIAHFSPTETAITSLRNWATEVEYWNLALDQNGGPVQPPNQSCKHCVGLVTVDPNTYHLRYNQAFYEIGQLSKFIRRGAVRVSTPRWVSDFDRSAHGYGITRGLDDVAVINPGGQHVLVAYNTSMAPIRFGVRWRGRAFAYTLASQAAVTFTWR